MKKSARDIRQFSAIRPTDSRASRMTSARPMARVPIQPDAEVVGAVGARAGAQASTHTNGTTMGQERDAQVGDAAIPEEIGRRTRGGEKSH